MIKRISIQNIQSHKDTTLELSPGINAIVGSSNNGKSAILRALYWVRYNRPLGTDNLLSHWAFDKKGNQIAPMVATVENENGVVTRQRTKSENQYIVNNEELNVVKTDVPSQVEDLLCLSDTNIQRQQDAPFLLSLTSGQVAQYFNKTVRLDVIDKVLSNAESKRRKTQQEINQTDELVKEFEAKHEKYGWLEDVEKLLLKYENVSKKNAELAEQVEELQKQVEAFDYYSSIEEKYSFVTEAKKQVEKIQKLQPIISEIQNRIKIINNDLELFEDCNSRTYSSFEKQKTLISKIATFENEKLEIEIETIGSQLNKYIDSKNKIEAKKNEVVELKKQLPKTCPLCGAVMKNGVCTK